MSATSGNARQYQRAREIFVQARALGPAERGPFLERACGSDSALRGEVNSLLIHDRGSDAFLDPPGGIAASAWPGSGPSEDLLAVGTHVGSYRVERFIAAGAMGNVYEAAQEHPHRRVALKVLRGGVASQRALRRFELEVEMLGRLHHPGIAQIFEAGAFEHAGRLRPFFALEFVDGRPLLDYSRAEQLSSAQQVQLMVRICEAVQHAHQKGIIHRDLKPANILVDQGGQPKVLDFGICRATDADMQITTLQTDLGQLVGTVPYMSPEQVRGVSADLDTRSDVYALGVICYELLSGRLPYDLSRQTLPQAIRIISEQEPVRLGSVQRAFRGDLETIVAKALEKDKQRRYGSVADLAADLTRYLDNEPIFARPASALYQLRKFASRHRGLVTGLAAACVMLVAGTIGVAVFAIRADRARSAAEAEAANAHEASAFIADILASADPKVSKGQDVTVRELLDKAAAKVAQGFEGQPEVKAYLHGTLGDAYHGLALYEQSALHLDAAADGYRQALGPEHEKTIRALGNRATIYVAQGDLETAERQLRENLALARRVLQPDHDHTLAVMSNLADLLMQADRMDEAEPLNREAYNLSLQRFGPQGTATLQAMSNLASNCVYLGRLDEAVELLRGSLALLEETQGVDDPRTLTVLANLASTLRKQGKLEEAGPLYHQALERKRRVLGGDHPNTLISLYNLATLVDSQDKFSDAEVLFQELVVTAGRAMPEGHWQAGVFRGAYGMNLAMQKRFEEAEVQLLTSLDVLRASLGEDHAQTRAALGRLRSVYKNWDKPEKVAEYDALLAPPEATADSH